MNYNYLDFEKLYHNQLIELSQRERLLRKALPVRPATRERLLSRAGDALIGLGTQMKKLSQPNSKPTTNQACC